MRERGRVGFEEKFRVLEEIPEGSEGRDIEVLGREIATGRAVVVHLLAGDTVQDQNAFLRKVLSLGAEKSKYVLEAGAYRGRAYMVTKLLPDGLSVRAWAAGGIAPHPLVSKPLSDAAAPEERITEELLMDELPEHVTPASQPGEFTLLFRPPAQVETAPVTHPAAAKAPEDERTRLFAAPFAGEPAQAPGPGEFTQLLRAAPGISQTPVSPVFEPAGSQATGTTEPGEFTRLFASEQMLPQPARPAANAPGEFTLSFAPPAPQGETRDPFAGLTGSSPPAVSARSEFSNIFNTPRAAEPQPDSTRDGGPAQSEFSRIFRNAPTPPAASAEGSTQLFSTPALGFPPAPVSDRLPAAAPSSAPAQDRAPGKYTQEFAAPAPPPAEPPPPAQQQALPAQSRADAPKPPRRPPPSMLPVIVGVAVLFTLAVLLVVFFAMRG